MSGSELRSNNEKIVKLITLLKDQRDEMNFLITKQQAEKVQIENDLEKLSFKLQLLTKSLNQRLQAKTNYDKTIQEIEENYSTLVEDSEKLLFMINKEVHQLEEIMDKKIGTGTVLQKPEIPGTSSDSMKEPQSARNSTKESSYAEEASQNEEEIQMNPYGNPPPINKSDENEQEIQSYREAYGKQHRRSSHLSSRAGSVSHSRKNS